MRGVLVLVLAACSSGHSEPAPIKFLHTFAPYETELFNQTMAERGIAVESSQVPFARGQQVIGEILRAGKGCPDLIRIDATWLPGLVQQGLLAPVPDALRALDWLPEVAATDGVPQTIDGLVVVRDQAAPAPKDDTIDSLVEAARAARHADRPHPLGLRADGYWFVPWLRAHGADLRPTPPNGDDPAVVALASFAQLFGDLADVPPPPGSEAPEELRRWQAHDIAYWVTGPWQIGALGDRDRLEVTKLAHAPRGGQMLVVPKCAQNPSGGWRLAGELTSTEVAQRFSDAFAIVPTRKASLAAAPPLVRATYAALQGAEPLAADPLTPMLFDDLNPAIAAVIAGDASPLEAIEGVRRGWDRLVRRERGAQR